MALSIHNQIIDTIKGRKRGNLIFPADFLNIGTETAIRKVLSRLVSEGMIIRLAKGIYLYPKIDKELGILFPSAEVIAEAIAKRGKLKILPTGSYALNKLGLSTQIPTKIVYLTDGEPRNLKVGKSIIVFKTTIPKKLAAKGKYSSLVIQALQELGKEKLTPKVLKRIEEVLRKEDISLINSDAKLAPAWIARILYEIKDKMSVDEKVD